MRLHVDTRLRARFSALLCVLVPAALGWAGAAHANRIASLPDTTTGIHVGLPFLRCYAETWSVGPSNSRGCNAAAGTSIRDLRSSPVDIGWMWTYGYYTPAETGGPTHLGAAFKIDRTPGWDMDVHDGSARPIQLPDWQRSHPDWIEYTCARQPAWEYGDVPASPDAPAYIPFDITNPQAREYMWQHFYRPSLAAGYRMLFFDNLSLSNFAHRCGHYDGAGQWVQQYSGDPHDNAEFKRDMLDWLAFLSARIHGYSPDALLAVNYAPAEGGDPAADYDRVFDMIDVLWSEGGFTRWDTTWPTGAAWDRQVQVLGDMAGRSDKALIVNGIVNPPGDPANAKAISAAQRAWIIANYLLVKGARTYTAVTTSDYGYYVDFPEYHLPIGAPLGPMHREGVVALREFAGGLAAVNPDAAETATVSLPVGTYETPNGRAISALRLAPRSAAIVVRTGGARRGAKAVSAAICTKKGSRVVCRPGKRRARKCRRTPRHRSRCRRRPASQLPRR